MSTLGRNMQSGIRGMRNQSDDARRERLTDLQDSYGIPLFWSEKLPVRKRKMTDCCCLILFLIVCISMIVSSAYILVNTDSEAMSRLYDSSGNDCGIGQTKDYPFLYMQRMVKPFRSVCLKECPRFDYNQIKYNSNGEFDAWKAEQDKLTADSGVDAAADSEGAADAEAEQEPETQSRTEDVGADDAEAVDAGADDAGADDAGADDAGAVDAGADDAGTDSSTPPPPPPPPSRILEGTTSSPATFTGDVSNQETSTDSTEDPAADSENETAADSENETDAAAPSEPEYPLDKDGNLMPLYFAEFQGKYAGRSRTKTFKMEDDEIFGYDEGWAGPNFTEEQWDAYMTNKVDLQCFPNDEVTSCDYTKGSTWIYDSYPVLGLVCSPLAPKTSLNFFKVSSKINHGMIGDLLESWPIFCYCALIALAASIVFLILTRCCGKWIVIILSVCTVLFLMAIGIIILMNYYMPQHIDHTSMHLHVKYRSFLLKNQVLFVCIAAGCIVASILLMVMLCKFRKELGIAYPVLEIAAKCSISNILLIILSIFIICLQICVLFFEVYVVLRLYTMGKEINELEDGAPFVDYEVSRITYALLALHAFGAYWVIIFLNNFNDFINASVTVNYYFDTKLRNINIFCHTLGHNCGSIAWTIVLLPTMLVKMIFSPFKWLCSSENPNKCQNCYNKMCSCCCKCYDFLFDSISENFMPLCYMGSENFNLATRRHYYLTQLYLDENETVGLLGTLYNWLGRTLITIVGGYCGVLIIQNNDELEQNVKYMGMIFALCFIVSFVLGSLMINIFSTAYETLFICFLVEKNIYDQKNKGGETYDLQARDDIEEAFLKIINDADDYARLNDQ